jgi:hypothetical protein
MMISPNSTLINAFNDFQSAISSFCGDDTASNMPKLVFRPHDNAIGKSPRKTYYGFIAAVNAHVTYEYKYILLLIFGISFCFQLFRVYTIYKKHDSKLYTPDGPDFSRWLEYMLTTPFQILIICSTVAISDNAALYNLMFLQGMLVLVGFLSELLIEQVYDHPQYDYVVDSYMLQLAVVFCAEWIVFGSIWKTIIDRYYRNNRLIQYCGTQENSGFSCSDQPNEKNCHGFDICEWQNVTKTCDNNNSIPSTIDLVIFGQFILFLAFGIVHTTQIFFAVYNCIMGYPNNRTRNWLFYSFSYSILSIVAKTILFCGVIVLLGEIPP